MATELRDFLKYNIDNTQIFDPSQVEELCNIIISQKFRTTKKRGGAHILEIPCAFDIETSSFYDDHGEKTAIMYVWQLSICGLVVIGSTWNEFVETLNIIARLFGLKLGEKHLIIYVHNLAYEFQFFRLWLDWAEVFAVDNRKPIHAVTKSGIEFKCSWVLSAFSLSKVGEHLVEIPVQKTDGLQYIALRHNKTPLTWNEIRYAVNDVQVVCSFIYEEIKRNGTISKIPLTNTGYVRSFCRRSCLQGFDNDPKKRKFTRFNYMNFIQRLTLTVDEYKQARRAFQGGFTHCNPFTRA